MNRWELYETLKGNRLIDKAKIVKEIESMNPSELKEGLIEYLLSREQCNPYSRTFNNSF